MQKTAVVTGASSGIGLAISNYLLESGYSVIGIASSAKIYDLEHADFTPLRLDLTDSYGIEKALSKETCVRAVSLLVNAAGFGKFAPLESFKSVTIVKMCALNLTAPILLTKLLLKSLKKSNGTVINITSIEATRSSKNSALYSATKSGLKAFSLALFEEVRRDGVKVVSINPDMTDTPFFDELDFGVDESNCLITRDIVDAVEMILNMRFEATITELTIRPQKFAIKKRSRR